MRLTGTCAQSASGQTCSTQIRDKWSPFPALKRMPARKTRPGYGLKNYDRALSDYNQVIRLDPSYAIAYNNRGDIYLEQKDYNKALSDYNQAIRLAPNFALAYRNRGKMFKEQGKNQEVEADFARAARLGRSKAGAW